jgi:hypothetical protein
MTALLEIRKTQQDSSLACMLRMGSCTLLHAFQSKQCVRKAQMVVSLCTFFWFKKKLPFFRQMTTIDVFLRLAPLFA